MAATFDGANLLIILDRHGVWDAKVELYSDWKEWVLAGNAWAQPAFETEGGRGWTATQDVAPYYYLRNDLGWRIRPFESDGEIFMVGNLGAFDTSLPVSVPTLGPYTVFWRGDASVNALVINTGESGLTAEEANDLSRLRKHSTNDYGTDEVTGKVIVLDDDGSPFEEAPGYEDYAETQVFRGQGIQRRGKFTPTP